MTGDTIAALSSVAAPAARILVRLSGPQAVQLVRGVLAQESATDLPDAGGARRLRLVVRQMVFPAWVYLFRAPRSYTGEDVVELHLPGNPLLARLMLETLLAAGARQAEAGEFTARAYFNGRLDLAEAEGVAALVSASNESERRAARQLLAGELARRLTPIMDQLAETLALLEVEIDFSDEDVTFLPRAEVAQRIDGLRGALRRLVSESSRFERLSHEPRIVLIGRPNAGKSTLLNALAGKERAVVSPVAGTTRDVLSAVVELRSGRVVLLDVAGVEVSAAPAPAGPDAPALAAIEQEMRRKALAAVQEADRVVLVQDDPAAEIELPVAPDLVVWTKADLRQYPPADDDTAIHISARSGHGMDRLRERLNELAFGEEAGHPSSGGGETLALNARHVRAIESAVDALERAGQVLDGGVEVIALDLREALDALGSILGVITPDDLLGRIFSRFCIGK